LDEQFTGSVDQNPEKTMVQHELKKKFMEFLAALPPKQRLAFELRFYKELSFAEIAKITNSALGTVKTNYRQAVAKLKEYALERGWK
jgi:RNA polymerase sigma-70 factor (ECF subfamily)